MQVLVVRTDTVLGNIEISFSLVVLSDPNTVVHRKILRPKAWISGGGGYGVTGSITRTGTKTEKSAVLTSLAHLGEPNAGRHRHNEPVAFPTGADHARRHLFEAGRLRQMELEQRA